ncbi:MAG: flagellin, partial [Campylobacteraceae bacterium]|nr:flagellin [Campylobacteraceae bacterium]
MAIDGINSNINNVTNLQNSSLERISSGSKINQASDDASSLSISESLRLQRSDLSQSLQNLNQGIALTRIASAGLENQQEILGDIKVKLLQANTDTTSAE